MDPSIIYNACFELASTLIAKKHTLTINKVEGNLTEQAGIANELNSIALEHLWGIIDNGSDEKLIARAINYIHFVHAIPPLKDNYFWFDEMLRTLLELTCPKIILDNQVIIFLDDLEKGIHKARIGTKKSKLEEKDSTQTKNDPQNR